MLETESRLIVRYAETDKMGIVHHSNYPIWFEIGRTDFISEIGVHYSKVEEEGIMLPLIELKCCYKAPAKYEDQIVVKTRLLKLSVTRITFYYEIYKEDKEDEKKAILITTGETTHVWTNKDLKPVNIKKHFPDIYELLEKCSEI